MKNKKKKKEEKYSSMTSEIPIDKLLIEINVRSNSVWKFKGIKSHCRQTSRDSLTTHSNILTKLWWWYPKLAIGNLEEEDEKQEEEEEEEWREIFQCDILKLKKLILSN